MLKRILALFLAMLMLAACAAAYTKADQNTADALNELGLFLGTNAGYELDSNLTRAQGITMLVRFIGKEKTASAATYNVPFKDVADWALPYVGYAYENKITNGISASKFGSNNTMTDYMFLTLLLRALGYSDSGSDAKYVWNDPYAFAKSLGLIAYTAEDKDFTRAEAVQIFWKAMATKFADGSKTMAEKLIADGVFTAAKYATAQNIQKNGRSTSSGGSVGGGGISGGGTRPGGSTGGSTSGGTTGGNTGGTTGGSSSGSTATPGGNYTYEDYLAMSDSEKTALKESFPSTVEYIKWVNEARTAYEEANPKQEIGADGTIDMSGIIGGKS